MEAPALLTIGQVARASGLTPKALRHYDAVGLLRPAAVDPASGYCRYSPEQVDVARLVCRLRRLELPVAEVHRLLTLVNRSDDLQLALAEHRRRLEARVVRLQRQLHDLDHLTREGIDRPMTTADHTFGADHELHRELASSTFNHVWTLLEREQRSEAEEAGMIHAAHASCFHWGLVGEPVNAVRGEWQCSRVYAVLGRPEPALYHATRALGICRGAEIADFDLAFCFEALARAHAVAGDVDEARRWSEQAHRAAAEIADPEDRELVLSDLHTIPLPPA